MRLAATFLLLLLAAAPARAVLPDEVLADPALEVRARAISQQLRCLVCQNQSIDDSDADLARDLRLLVRERLVAGDDDAAVIEFVAARYGDFVRLEPPVTPATWALWYGPLALLGLGIGAGAAWLKRRRAAAAAAEAPLSEAERQRLAALLRDGGAP